jgi:hypothetical protein
MSVEASEQFHQLEFLLTSQQQLQGPDNWHYIWGNSEFSSKKAYKHLRGRTFAPHIFKWIWKFSCQPKHKVFSG